MTEEEKKTMEKISCKRCVKQYMCDLQRCDFFSYTKINNYGEVRKKSEFEHKKSDKMIVG